LVNTNSACQVEFEEESLLNRYSVL